MATSAAAKGIQIAPVGLHLSKQQPIASVTVTNSGETPSTIHVETHQWAQDNGHDVLTPTRELLVTPPIFTLQPGQSQVVRAGLRRPFGVDVELSYRAIFREVPARVQGNRSTGLQFALNISIPVFAAPTQPSEHALRWQVERADPHSVRLHVRNTSGAHAKITAVQLVDTRTGAVLGPKQNELSYILSGSAREWRLPLNQVIAPGTPVKVVADMAHGVINANVTVQ